MRLRPTLVVRRPHVRFHFPGYVGDNADLVRKIRDEFAHQCPLQLGPGVAAELDRYFADRLQLRGYETTEHGVDPVQDPGCYLAAEQQEGYHHSLHDLNTVSLPDLREWEKEEDDYHADQVQKDQPAASDVHVDVPMGSTTRRRRKKTEIGEEEPETIGDAHLEVTVAKADDERRIVYGVVLEPDQHGGDSQGDVVSKADVELAAWRFLYNQEKMGDQHRRLAPDSVRPVESYIAPADFMLGTEPVKKGSWVLGVHVPDDDLWQQVKDGRKAAFSVAGSGKRVPL